MFIKFNHRLTLSKNYIFNETHIKQTCFMILSISTIIKTGEITKCLLIVVCFEFKKPTLL